jgi:hypothetical protein
MAIGCSINDGGVFQETHLLGAPNLARLFKGEFHTSFHYRTSSSFTHHKRFVCLFLKSDIMDGNARRRGPRRVPASPSSHQSDQI